MRYREIKDYFSLHLTYSKRNATSLDQKYKGAHELLAKYSTETESGESALLNPGDGIIRNMFAETEDLNKLETCPFRLTVYMHGKLDDTNRNRLALLVSELEQLAGVKSETY